MGIGSSTKLGTGRPRLLDGVGMAAFVGALEKGASVRAAAKGAGFSASTFYNRRAECALFRAAWEEALETSRVPVLIAHANKRRLQKQRMRNARFTLARKEMFLAHFATHCDTEAGAEAAGVSVSTVSSHRRNDADFAEAWQAALEQGYAELEAEAVRGRLEARRRMRAAVEGCSRPGRSRPPLDPLPEDREGRNAEADEFERTLKLLHLYQRRSGRVGARAVHRERLTRWSFDEAIVELEKKLKALGVRVEEERASPAPDTDESRA